MTSEKHSDDHDEIDCTIAIEQFYAYLDGELTDEETVAKLEQHMTHCKSCFSRKELELGLNKQLQKTVEDQVPESLQERLHKLVDNF